MKSNRVSNCFADDTMTIMKSSKKTHTLPKSPLGFCVKKCDPKV